MKVINFQIFEQGIDISIERNDFIYHYSLCSIAGLWKQKNSKKFKQLIIDNIVMPIDYNITYNNFCKTEESFNSKKEYLLNWIFS